MNIYIYIRIHACENGMCIYGICAFTNTNTQGRGVGRKRERGSAIYSCDAHKFVPGECHLLDLCVVCSSSAF